MEHLLYILDWFLYIIFAINVVYLLVYSLASLRRCKTLVTLSAVTHKRFVILIAAYREDTVILPTVHACLAQDYPCENMMLWLFQTICNLRQMQLCPHFP